ncbi:hypothetical protein HPB51_025860 [Rhipicephalus microplus]|uniref:Uncharacterized protein n=1 Tax=Rhipicephalus microplus TaxID=6941 RepID=A0A9J6FB04_RHIMP|nr:hypothetical protein HPB51_025860 [Rhipicephalus microplus]
MAFTDQLQMHAILSRRPSGGVAPISLPLQAPARSLTMPSALQCSPAAATNTVRFRFTRTRQVSPASQSKVRTQAHAEQATARDTVAPRRFRDHQLRRLGLLLAAAAGQLLDVPPAVSATATGASNGLPVPAPHSTRTSPASSRPPSASPLPRPVPVSVSWVYDGPQRRAFAEQSLPSRRCRHRQPPKQLPPSPLCPWPRRQVLSSGPRRRIRWFRLAQSSHLWCPPADPAETTTDPAQAVERQREHDDAFGSGHHPVQSPRAAQHKATPRPAPVPAPQPATTVQRGAAMGLNTGSPLLIGNPAAAQPGMFRLDPCAHGTFPAEPVHSGPGATLPDSDTRHNGA